MRCTPAPCQALGNPDKPPRFCGVRWAGGRGGEAAFSGTRCGFRAPRRHRALPLAAQGVAIWTFFSVAGVSSQAVASGLFKGLPGYWQQAGKVEEQGAWGEATPGVGQLGSRVHRVPGWPGKRFPLAGEPVTSHPRSGPELGGRRGGASAPTPGPVADCSTAVCSPGRRPRTRFAGLWE